MDLLKKKIEFLKSTISENDTGHLPLNERVELMKLINNPLTVNKIFFECIKKVYTIWEAEYPQNEIMIDLLNKSNSYLYENTGDKKEFAGFNDKYFTYFESLNGIYALIGLAECALCFNITHDASLILKIEDYEGEDDNQYTHDTWNPDFLASMAYSGGNPFLEEGTISKRKEFWLWYLDVVSELSANSTHPILNLNISQSTSDGVKESFQRSQTDETEEIQQLFNKVLNLSIELIKNKQNNHDWQKVLIDSCCLKASLSAFIKFINKDGELVKIDAASNFSYYSDLTGCLNDIKKAMYQQVPHEGAWVMSHLNILNDKSYTITYNYDNFEAFSKIAKNPENMMREFETYPRSKEFTPEWWQNILGKKAKYLK